MTKGWKWQGVYDSYLSTVQTLTSEDEAIAQDAADTVREAWNNDGKTKLSQHKTLMNQFRSRLKDDLPDNHVGLITLTLSPEEWTFANQATTQRTVLQNQQQHILVPKTVNAIATRAANLLTSLNWREVAVGLAIVTGRRMSEIMKTAVFEYASDFSLLFSGAIKRRGEVSELHYEIPTLCSAQDAFRAMEQLREMQPTTALTIPECNRFSLDLNTTCDALFADLIPAPSERNRLNFHSLRAIYAAIAVYFYCPLNVADAEFRAHIQGHFEKDDGRPLKERRSLSSDRHYLAYAIADEDGHSLKGIRLDWRNVSVLHDFQLQDPIEIEDSTMAQPDRATIGVWTHDKLRLETLLDRLAPTDPHFPDSWAVRMEKFIDWAEQNMKTPTHGTQGQNANLEALIIQQSEAIAKLAYKVEHAVGQPELEQQLEVVTKQRDEAIAQLQQVRSALGLTIETASVAAPAPLTSPPTASQTSLLDTTNLSSFDTVQRHDYEHVDPDVVIAIRAMMALNERTTNHNQKWRISTDPLRVLLTQVGKSSTPKIVKAMKAMKTELDDHHTKHGIGPRHNRIHGGTDKIGDLISLRK